MISYYRMIIQDMKDRLYTDIEKTLSIEKQLEGSVYKIVSECYFTGVDYKTCSDKIFNILIVEGIL